MRLLLVCHEYPPYGGGASTALAALGAALSSLSHEVTILTTASDADAGASCDAAGTRIVRLGIGKRSTFAPSPRELGRCYLALRRAIPQIMAQRRPELVVAFFAFPAGRAALRACRRNRTPLVVWLRGSDVPGFSDERWKWVGRLRGHILRPVWRHADLLLANGRTLAELALAYDPSRPVTVVENGVDTETYRPPARLESLEPTLLYVGQLLPRKRCELFAPILAELAHKVPQARLTIVGDGPSAPAMRAAFQAHGLSDRVHFAGALPRSEVARSYRNHCFLLHLSRAEGVSNVLLEALASGLCVVASPQACAAVEDAAQICRIVDPPEPKRVAAEVASLLREQRDQAVKLRRAARHWAEQRSWPAVAKRFEQIVRPLA